ncbi:Bug family tripartite tricarboxylate transporter substrate binding protein [Neoroseomonas oryzicola]|uniref:Tripartite tricarboxylate transporter substrate binding protein n=1 Tax=Neoroseomonas oryzicola TaxID=535904 RepID=A0A9X9WGZ4_9PROT|nr:tripartite tricarboxylate transporter substrate binding protein [Neoroseomonas oryzicola]MBR0659604.1 tripartite tricarboxylate transporter substrate binding protein [Neoroseomonas oryzicola]NKE15535.1 tripartite tricarboxylate transporter substrate binding protein [Neoroseomonas oryzicola]
MATLAAPAFAQAPWPNRPVRILVGFPAGGTTDILGRLAAQILQESLGQPFVVENRPGAGSNIAAQAVLRSPADGYTLLLGSPGTNAINPHLYANAGFDPLKDFLPIGQIAEVPNLIAAHPGVGARDAAALIALAKQRTLSYGETSIGGSTHLAAELFRLMGGFEATHVSYRGSAPMMTDLLPGRIDFGCDNLPSIMPHIRSGALVAIGVTSAERWPANPEIPAIAETLPGYEVTAWFGLVAPRGTPPEIIARTNAALRAGLEKPEIVSRMAELGARPLPGTPEVYQARNEREFVRLGDLIRRVGIRAE